MPTLRTLRRWATGSAAALAGAFLVLAVTPARAATDTIQFLGSWRIKAKGLPAGHPGATVSDQAESTTFTFDPGPSGSGRTLSLVAKRKMRVADVDGGGSLIRIDQLFNPTTDRARCTADVWISKGTRTWVEQPLWRQLTQTPFTYDVSWFVGELIPAGDYDINIKITYKRDPDGTFGSALPPRTPHQVIVSVQDPLLP